MRAFNMNYLNWAALVLTLSTRLASAASSPMDTPASPDYEAMELGSESQSDQPPIALSEIYSTSEALAADLQKLPKHPAEEFQKGQRIEYRQLSYELKSLIIDYAIVGNRNQLLLMNKEFNAFVKNHPYERALDANQLFPEINQLGQEAIPQLHELNQQYREAIRLSQVGIPSPLETNPDNQEYNSLLYEAIRLANQLKPFLLETTRQLQEVFEIWRRIMHH
ncbi:hypothetical protein H4R33_005220 [Dimargaris cristalligena]|nr:hypothetical protein H4R33_005220 [Dimargaris cristalligena]